MQIFTHSSTSLSSKRTLRTVADSSRGFSLVELLVSIAIMVLILGTVVVRFTSFDSLILLRTLGHDVALTVRKAQTYSLSVLGNSGDFQTPYGVSFTPDATSYPLFAYGGSSARPKYDGTATALETFALGRNYIISDVCVIANSVEDCNVSRLDISFVRPEFSALFYVPTYTEVQNAAISTGVIKLQSQRDTTVTGRIEIGYTGQISVVLQ